MNDVDTHEQTKPSKPSFVGPICMAVLAGVSVALGRIIAGSMESTRGGLLGAVQNANKRTNVMATFDVIAAGLALAGVIMLVRVLSRRKRT